MRSTRAAALLASFLLSLASHAGDGPVRDAHGTHAWELSGGDVVLRDGRTAALIHRFRLEGAIQSASRDSRPPHLVLGPTGVAYASSNSRPSIWRIDPATLRVERIDFELDADAARDFGFTGLSWSGPTTLDARASTGNARWRLDLATARASKLPE